MSRFDFDHRTRCSQCEKDGVACVVFHLGDDGDAATVCFECLVVAFGEAREYLRDTGAYPTDANLLAVGVVALEGAVVVMDEDDDPGLRPLGKKVWDAVIAELSRPVLG